MRYITAGTLTLLCLLGCGPGTTKKKAAAARAQQQAEFDYREALTNYKIGVNYLNDNQPLRALEYLNTAVEQDGGNYRYRHSLALAYVMNGQLEEGERECLKAVEINPESSETLNLLASIYIDSGNYAKAVDVLKKVIADRSYPHPQFAYFNLGLTMLKLNRETEAMAAFEQATRIDPDFHRAYIKLGELYKDRKEYPRALRYFLKAERGYPENAEILFEIGHLFFQLKRYEEAKKYLVQVSIMFPPPHIDEATQKILRILQEAGE